MSVTATPVAPAFPRNVLRACTATAAAAIVAAGAYGVAQTSSASGSASGQHPASAVATPPSVLTRHVAGMWSASEVAEAKQSSATQLPAQSIRLGR